MTKIFIEHGANISATDASGYLPLDLSLGGRLANIEAVKHLIRKGALALLKESQNIPSAVSKDATLEGLWEGTYAYASGMKWYC